MTDYLKSLLSGESGKPSRTGTAGLFLVIIFAGCFIFAVVGGNKVALEAMKSLGSYMVGIIVPLLVASKAADAYHSTRPSGGNLPTTELRRAERKSPSLGEDK